MSLLNRFTVNVEWDGKKETETAKWADRIAYNKLFCKQDPFFNIDSFLDI